MSKSTDQTLALRDYVHVVRRRKWIIVAAAMAIPLAAIVLSLLQTPVYEASAKVLLSRQNLASRLTGVPESSASVEGETFVNTQAQVARVPAIAEGLLRRIGLGGMSPEEFLADSSVSKEPEAEILTFHVRNTDAEVASRGATAYAEQYSRYRQQQDTASLTAARKGVERRIENLQETGLDSGSFYTSLLNREQQLQTIATLQTSNTTVVERAGPAAQVSPRPFRNAVLGLLLGIAVGLGLAFLVEALDTRIRNAKELEEHLHVPLLARVPKGGGPPSALAMLTDPASGQAEAFRMLRTNIEFALIDRKASSIMVTSALSEEGKSTTISNLALALAQAGKRIILVDLDLRRPKVDMLFDLPRSPGVAQVVLGQAPLDEALNEVPILPDSEGQSQEERKIVSGGSLRVLTSGPIPPNPGEFVASRRMAELLAELRGNADLVLIDAPPLLHVGDAATLSADVDALFVVARLQMLRRGVVDEASRMLDSVRAEKLGFVITGADEQSGYGYYAYQGYTYGSGEQSRDHKDEFVT